jgi:hypothetical protein
MDRLTALTALTQQKGFRNYLEIGVFNGHIFFRIRSSFKVAVDPAFIFGNGRKAVKLLINPYNYYNRYFRKTSDDFFGQDAPQVFANKKIELALVDGMHEYEFALRDVENILNYSSEEVVILLHDCNPVTRDASCSYEEWEDRKFSGTWNGDVWKTVLYLRSQRKDLTCFVLDCDHGLGIVVKRPNNQLLPYSPEQIKNFTYDDFDRSREKWLDLRPASYFYDFFKLSPVKSF